MRGSRPHSCFLALVDGRARAVAFLALHAMRISCWPFWRDLPPLGPAPGSLWQLLPSPQCPSREGYPAAHSTEEPRVRGGVWRIGAASLPLTAGRDGLLAVGDGGSPPEGLTPVRPH